MFSHPGLHYGEIPFWNSNTNSFDVTNNSLHIGNDAGLTGQSGFGIAIGISAGQSSQQGIGIGFQAAQYNQSYATVAIGFNAGQTGQSAQSVCIGQLSGNINQGSNSVAIGNSAGQSNLILLQLVQDLDKIINLEILLQLDFLLVVLLKVHFQHLSEMKLVMIIKVLIV